MRSRHRDLRPALDQLDDRCLLSAFTPAELTQAYGLDAITFPTSSGTVQGDGSGETIALIEAYHDPNLVSDLHTFDQEFNLPDPVLTVDTQKGAKSNVGWAAEESLDVEWAHAIAPAANILVVEAKSQSITSLLAAVDTARKTPGVNVVSMSWGYPEVRTDASYNSHFRTPAGHVGITFVASSGDSGAKAGIEYPSASPDVLAVGGTSLYVRSSGSYLYEYPWIGSGLDYAWEGGGGGMSRYEPEPAYQRSVQSTGKRTAPDVAFDADPSTGVWIYLTLPSTGQSGWATVGGTSFGAPSWAAIIAIADQGRALAGRQSLDGPTQTLPSLYAFASADRNTANDPFHQIPGEASGNTETGLGSPNGPALVADLVASTITIPLKTSRRA